MNPEAKEFWVIVQNEFLQNNSCLFCDGSKTFKSFWSNYSDRIIIHRLAEKFCQSYNLKHRESIKNVRDGIILFWYVNKDEMPNSAHREVRLQFLEYLMQTL